MSVGEGSVLRNSVKTKCLLALPKWHSRYQNISKIIKICVLVLVFDLLWWPSSTQRPKSIETVLQMLNNRPQALPNKIPTTLW